MTNKSPQNLLPINKEKLIQLQDVIKDFSSNQIAWISGYLWGLLNNKNQVDKTINIENFSVTIISASQTGNANIIAKNLYEDLISAKITTKLINIGNYNFKKINQEKYLIIVTSTQGEGEPPEEAIAFYDFLMSKKAPKITSTKFAVFGLGDTSYTFFSKTGKDFDLRLFELGGTRLLKRVDADIEYKKDEAIWRKSILEILCIQKKSLSIFPKKIDTNKKNIVMQYNQNNPFLAKISKKQKITGRFSNKEIIHIEIDLGNSGIIYHPGDSLGIIYENDPYLVKNFIDLLKLDENHEIILNEKKIKLLNALKKDFELTVNTPKIAHDFAKLSGNQSLLNILIDKNKLQKYIKQTPIIEMIKQFPCNLETNQFIKILRPLKPRFYSIASSQLENDNEVHITVNIIRYLFNQKKYTGGASGYLADRIQENEIIKIFIEENNNFRLPEDHNIPIIMIGPGTGIAPFRAFIQERYNINAKGKNWLFFGNQKFTEDFLYQIEWQNYIKLGVLNRIDLAWSRDQDKKIYVQDKIKENSIEIWQWIKEGAYIYVCGDANNMAKDVEKILLKEVICKIGNISIENSKEFLNELRLSKRYQRDIY